MRIALRFKKRFSRKLLVLLEELQRCHMKVANSRREWFHRSWGPLVLLGVCALIWTGLINFVLYRVNVLGLPGIPFGGLSLGVEFQSHVLSGAGSVFLVWLFFAIAMGLAVRCFRWRVMLASIAIVGTPIALFVGQPFSRYLRDLDSSDLVSGDPISAGVGLIIAGLVGLIADYRIDRLEEVAGRKVGIVPSFRTAYILSLAVLLIFVLWVLLDASFPIMLDLILVDLGLAESTFTTPLFTYNWNMLGPRLAAFGMLAGFALASVAVVVVRHFVGRGTGRTILGIMLMTALVAGWFSLFVSYDRLAWWGMRFRVTREVPRFKEVATQLQYRWPTKNGSLPQMGDYVMTTRNGSDKMLFTTPPAVLYPFHETFGNVIWPCEDGGLRFALHSRGDCFVEYHPNDTAPETLSPPVPSDLSRREPLRAVRLEHSWYLTQYSLPANSYSQTPGKSTKAPGD